MSANRITNGDFSSGNTGFQSQYLYGPDNAATCVYPSALEGGCYAIETSPRNAHAGLSIFVDHSGSGNMMVANGAPTTDYVWRQTVTVPASSLLAFSVWAASAWADPSPANLRIEIDTSAACGTNTFTTIGTVTATSTAGQWVQSKGSFLSGTSTQVCLRIVNQNTALGGNDFVIDDLFMDIDSTVPTANNDSAQTTLNQVVVVDVLGNDTAGTESIDTNTIDLDPATAGNQTSYTDPGKGTFTVVNSGGNKVQFTPSLNYVGTATASYRVSSTPSVTPSNVATITVTINAPPTASAVTLTGTAVVGQTLTGSYTYGDNESDLQNTTGIGTSYRFVRSTDNSVATPVDDTDAATGSTGGNNDTYTVVSADVGKYLFYCVTPKATSGTLAGAEVCSSATAQVPTPVDGVCSGDHGQTLTATPTNLCMAGAPSSVTSGTTNYTWSCNGTGGSSVNAACSATRNYLVTPSAGANGSITPNTVQQVAYHATPSFTVTANSGYVATVTGTCGGSLVGTTYTTDAVTTSCSVAATFGVENDGVDMGVENNAPNSGDGNGDGTPDSQQQNVASLPRPDGGYLTLVTSCAAGLTVVQTYTEASQSGGDPLYNLPYGQVGFSAACANATFTVYYHGVSSVAGMTYRKYGPTTPGDVATMGWYTLPGVTFGTATVGGQAVATATFTLNDNQLGDDTGNDGVIVDQGGPGNGQSAAAIPTLSQWGMILLSSLLAIGTVLTLRRQRS